MFKLRAHARDSVTSIRSISSTGTQFYRPIRKSRTDEQIQELRKEICIDDHEIGMQELVERYNTDVDMGLTQAKANELLRINGPNCLVPTATTSKWLVLAGFLFGGFNTLLWISTILTFIGYGISFSQETEVSHDTLYLGLAIILVILVTGFFGFYQESTNAKIMESFKKLVPKFAKVTRNGVKQTIPSEELVIGDIVELKAGDMVPADVRVIESYGMKVDNSSITGESKAVYRSTVCTDIHPMETSNLAFHSTLVVEGRGRGLVIKCGDDTLIGHIAGLTSSLEKEETLLHREIKHFVRIITLIAFVIATVFFIISLVIGYDFFKSLTFFIAMLVANVPEGLPVTLTACMTLTAKKMARKNCLVKKLGGMESLGSCNVICSDKTGTLTQNIMTVVHVYYDGKERDVLSSLDDVDVDNEAFQAMCNVGVLCSTATFLEKDSSISIQQRKCSGDASESAILKLLEKLLGDIEKRRKLNPKICEIPFSSINKFQVSIHFVDDNRTLLVMKGAPEQVLERCQTIVEDGQTTDLVDHYVKSIQKSIIHFSNNGDRVIAFADFYLPKEYDWTYPFNSDRPNFPLTGLRFVGLVSMIDPPRESVPQAVAKCKSAGIRVIMITGDHPATAAAIARKVGIISSQGRAGLDDSSKHSDKLPTQAMVVGGPQLREMSDLDLEIMLMEFNEIVFARTSPQQKLKIVEALQRLNLVVAVTGDGVNDSPALKKADIGIAMGITGSDVSKEAADMILLDDNFASIVTGIEEGRLIFDNLKKSVTFVLTSNVPEIVPFLMLVLLNIPEALNVMAILVINVGTDLWPAISLAYERAEADIMKRNPRNPKTDKLLNYRLLYMVYGQIGLLHTCASFAAYFIVMARHGFFLNQLIGLRADWESPNVDILDSYDRTWTYKERQMLSRKCYAGFFLSITATQIADLLKCKTRRLSFFQQGMTNNVLNAGIMFAVILAGFAVYCPGVNAALQFEPINLICILPALPYALVIFLYDEYRKYCIRNYPNGFFAEETYY